jgi:hypothetical protein
MRHTGNRIGGSNPSLSAPTVSWVSVYAIYGLTRLAVHSVGRMVRAAARLGLGRPYPILARG